MRDKIVVMLLLIVAAGTVAANEHAEEMAQLRSQVQSYKAKLKDIRAKIDHETGKATMDSTTYAAFIKDQAVRNSRAQEERDSLLVLVQTLRQRRDSLSRAEDALYGQKQSIAGQQAALQTDLRLKCRQLIEAVTALEPFNMKKQIGALRFLEGEITAGTVSAPEAIERYRQIVSQIEQASHRIEIWNGESPVPAIKGEVRFLRMGFVWLACIGGDNMPAFVYHAGQGKWEELKDADRSSAVRKAMQVAGGMASPQLVALPVLLDLRRVHQEVKP